MCQLFEAMTLKGRLAIIQRKQLCQFCFRHPDTQPCPSHSLPTCPIRGCMRRHHRMLHKVLMKEEARPIVAEVDSELGWRRLEEGSHATSLEGMPVLTDDESEGEGSGGVPRPPIWVQAERLRLCQQRVPVEAEGTFHSLHTLYDCRSTVTLVRRESARRMGLRPVRTGQRSVRGFEGRTVVIDSCHFLPLVDARGAYQVICAYELEEIATVAQTRLPSCTREVFLSVRAHMPWMDTEAGPVELLIGLDNTQWLPIHLEDSRDQEVNMRLMKSTFGHQFMIMGGWGTAFYPRNESMRYQGDPSGERLGSAEEARKIQLQEYQGWSHSTWSRGSEGARGAQACGSRGRGGGGRGRVAIRRPSPPRERTIFAGGQRGARGCQGRGGCPTQRGPPHNPPPPQCPGPPFCGGQWLSRVTAARSQ